jgi:mRNA interferase RelE/StbE
MWKINYKKIFLKELSKLPKQDRLKIEILAFEKLSSATPFENIDIKKMTGYKDKYRIRVGNYRLGLTVDIKQQIITLNRIAHRKDIYNIFP